MNALVAQGFVLVHEGFEDDLVWGAVRTTIPGGPQTAPSISNLGITWTSNSPNNGITTSNGAATSGLWVFYPMPHGDYENGFTDGFRDTGNKPMVAMQSLISSLR